MPLLPKHSFNDLKLVCLQPPNNEHTHNTTSNCFKIYISTKMSATFWLFTVNLCILATVKTIAAVSDARLAQGTNLNLGDALQFLREYDVEASGMCFRVSSAQWNYATNITDFNKRRMIEEQTLRAKFERLSWRKAISFEWSRLPDPMARRQLRMLVTEGRASLPDDKYNEIYHLIAEMKDVYANTKVCPYNNFDARYCDLELEPDVSKMMANSRNPDELAHIWREWHDKVGPPMKNKFMRFVQLANQAARMNGFSDAGEQMQFAYETDDLEDELLETWLKLEPLYKELYTYVRKKLIQRYGDVYIRPDGPIPAHLLGNLWAQDWSNIKDIVMPFSNVRNIEVTDEMLRQGFTPLRMFQMAEEFFTSLGLKAMPPEFWRYSMLERPLDRRVQCTASAWDFCNRVDYRIKQCTQSNMDSLISTHHEMAHVQYYLQYVDQPYLYRDGANPGFHEGVASAISMSINNPVHLHRIGLFNNGTDVYETNLNFLMTSALEKLAYAPFAYLVDKWRSKVFRDGVKNMNSAWWELRLQYQGIVPPIPRTEAHLDPMSKRHIPADLPYTRYYVALLLQFQIHEALCDAAGHGGQLHMCDIYRSRDAGRLLAETLKFGKSKHWKDIIRILTSGKTDRLSADAMLRYYQPLELWLRVQNRDEIIVGWKPNTADTALFQPLRSAHTRPSSSCLMLLICCILLVLSTHS